MNLDLIERLVDDAVQPNAVVERLFHLACVRHTKSASYNNCDCPYCAVIKQYVRAKIRFNRLDRDFGWDPHRYPDMQEQLESRYHIYMLNFRKKEEAKQIYIDYPKQVT